MRQTEANDVSSRLGQRVRYGLFLCVFAIAWAVSPIAVRSAPYAAFVMDARTGEVIHARNADTPLHPASLTKMMTLYIAFQAIERGEVNLDTMITVTSQAANEPPSKLGLRSGQQIKLRYLIRAAAVKSANDAAMAIGIGLSGSKEGFARRMNQTAAAMGMTRTHFLNPNGLTEVGHYSTAHDMSILGRHLIYDFPQYYNLFSRRTADAGMAQVNNTNRRFLDSYEGADGIKTGFTNAAGYNLTASAQRGNVRIIATVFGGTSTANRNAKVAELLDMGFARAPANARVRVPTPPSVPPADVEDEPLVVAGNSNAPPSGAGKTIRVNGLITTSIRPRLRPGQEEPDLLVADSEVVDTAVAAAIAAATAAAAPEPEAVANAVASVIESTEEIDEAAADESSVTEPGEDATLLAEITPTPQPEVPASAAIIASSPTPRARPTEIVMASADLAPQAVAAAPAATPTGPEIVTRVSTSGGHNWGINVGRYGSRYEAERVLLRVALNEMSTLDGSLRRVVQSPRGFDANFVGMDRDTAELACKRLQARGTTCFMLGE